MSGEINLQLNGLIPEDEDVRVSIARLNRLVTGIVARMAEGSVSSRELADEAISGAKIPAGAIEDYHLAAQAVRKRHLAAWSVGKDAIEPGAVETQSLADNAVTLSKIAFPITPQVMQGLSVGYQLIDTHSTWTDITGLSVTITPASAASKFLLSAVVGLAVEMNDETEYALLRFMRNDTKIPTSNVATAFYLGTDSVTVPMQFLDEPATAAAITYKVQAYVPYASVFSKLHINGMLKNTTATGCCSLVVREII